MDKDFAKDIMPLVKELTPEEKKKQE